MPRLAGKTLKAAQRAIRRADCRIGKIERRRSSKVGRGRVISQKPKPEARRRSGAQVKLTISKG